METKKDIQYSRCTDTTSGPSVLRFIKTFLLDSYLQRLNSHIKLRNYIPRGGGVTHRGSANS